MKNKFLYFLAIILTLFGLLTLFLSTSVILDWFDIRAKEGNYVLFVVWANFICSLIYLIAGIGLVQLKKWTTYILSIAVALLIITFLGLLIHINSDGIYETKTVGAMIFRTLITLLFAVSSYFIIKKNKL